MKDSMNKVQLIERMRRSRAEWEAVIELLEDDQLTLPGVCGAWLVKSLMAPISWYEGEMINVLQTRALVGSELWSLSVDQRNARMYEKQKESLLQDIRKEPREIFDMLLELMVGLKEQALHDPSWLSEMPQEWQPWRVLASNTYEQYEDHKAQVQRWLIHRRK
ncbi:MAG: hypothetical protein AMJ92_07030 [candidate division Zixibacteria bacterium SM23_81]|nr:MAG: hypothetical protein AMJ92_07030 [candidate division Zixibacteria bacterium SM23_81]